MISRLLRPALGLQQLSRSLFSVHHFTKLNELNEYLSTNKPTFTVVYFRAAWNPQCEEADRHIDQLSKEFSHVKIIKIDSDKSPMIARHYSVKVLTMGCRASQSLWCVCTGTSLCAK